MSYKIGLLKKNNNAFDKFKEQFNLYSNHYALNKYDNQVDRNPIQERSQINLSVNPWGKMWGGKKKKGRKYHRQIYIGGLVFLRPYGQQMKNASD